MHTIVWGGRLFIDRKIYILFIDRKTIGRARNVGSYSVSFRYLY